MPDGMSSLSKPLVLVVEDEAALATMLRYNLEKQGFRVEEAADGQEALTRIAETQPDLVLLDWMLPVMSGIEVCRQIRRRSATRDLPVIMVTARTEDQDAVRGLNTGADDYITKPFTMDALLARMRALLRRSNAVPTKGQLAFHDITMDLAAHRVSATGGRCIWARPSSGCWSSSCSIRGGCSRARNCWTRCGVPTSMSSRARSTCTSAGCASRSTARANWTWCARCAPQATRWIPSRYSRAAALAPGHCEKRSDEPVIARSEATKQSPAQQAPREIASPLRSSQ